MNSIKNLKTAEEIRTEICYRQTERLGLLCLDGVPSVAEEAMAKADAEEWLERLSAAATDSQA